MPAEPLDDDYRPLFFTAEILCPDCGRLLDPCSTYCHCEVERELALDSKADEQFAATAQRTETKHTQQHTHERRLH